MIKRMILSSSALAAILLPVAGPASAQELPRDAAATYCTNLADAAADARYARQLAALRAAEDEVRKRLEALEQKRLEYEDWLEKRQVFLALAEDNIVTIYAGMRPEAASEQLAAMDEATAAAIIAKSEPRTAAAILNEMEAEKAARLAIIVAGLSERLDTYKLENNS